MRKSDILLCVFLAIAFGSCLWSMGYDAGWADAAGRDSCPRCTLTCDVESAP